MVFYIFGCGKLKALLYMLLWRQLKLCQVIVGTLAIRGVHLNLNPSPLQEFDAICKVFVAAAETSNRAARALVRRHPLVSMSKFLTMQKSRFYKPCWKKHAKHMPIITQKEDLYQRKVMV